MGRGARGIAAAALGLALAPVALGGRVRGGGAPALASAAFTDRSDRRGARRGRKWQEQCDRRARQRVAARISTCDDAAPQAAPRELLEQAPIPGDTAARSAAQGTPVVGGQGVPLHARLCHWLLGEAAPAPRAQHADSLRPLLRRPADRPAPLSIRRLAVARDPGALVRAAAALVAGA